jgi:hypothetical protein
MVSATNPRIVAAAAPWSLTAWFSNRCVGSGHASPACSATVQPFFRVQPGHSSRSPPRTMPFEISNNRSVRQFRAGAGIIDAWGSCNCSREVKWLPCAIEPGRRAIPPRMSSSGGNTRGRERGAWSGATPRSSAAYVNSGNPPRKNQRRCHGRPRRSSRTDLPRMTPRPTTSRCANRRRGVSGAALLGVFGPARQQWRKVRGG